MTSLSLIGDIGGTNARFAVVSDGQIIDRRQYLCADFGSLTKAISFYLNDTGVDTPPPVAALSVAGPVKDNRVKMTNHQWDIDAGELSNLLSVSSVTLFNDFEAIAWALPALTSGDLRTVQSGARNDKAPAVVLGPGTGLGVAAFIPGHGPVATEGGHMTISAINDREWEIVSALKQQFGHASYERAVSGMGLEAVYEILSGTNKVADEITRCAADGSDTAASETVQLFATFLAAAGADLALAYGAHGGVYLAGGILPKIVDDFPNEAFTRRFTDKGRFHDYLKAIPVHIVTAQSPALLGLKNWIDSGLSSQG